MTSAQDARHRNMRTAGAVVYPRNQHRLATRKRAWSAAIFTLPDPTVAEESTFASCHQATTVTMTRETRGAMIRHSQNNVPVAEAGYEHATRRDRERRLGPVKTGRGKHAGLAFATRLTGQRIAVGSVDSSVRRSTRAAQLLRRARCTHFPKRLRQHTGTSPERHPERPHERRIAAKSGADNAGRERTRKVASSASGRDGAQDDFTRLARHAG